MRKTGWAGAAAGLFSVALLLSACGGGGSTSGGGSTASAGTQSTTSPNGGSTAANPQPSGGTLSKPPTGAKYFSIQKSALNGKQNGYVLVDTTGYVVYTYSGDSPGKAATCTGACAALWPPIMGVGLKSPADNLPGTFGVVNGQITYNGLPLYTFKGAKTHISHAGGQWKDIKMSCSNVIGGCPQ